MGHTWVTDAVFNKVVYKAVRRLFLVSCFIVPGVVFTTDPSILFPLQ